jgi:hypothetical protein
MKRSWSRLEPTIRRPLLLTAGWTVLASAACFTTFAISTFPAPMPDGRNVPTWLWCAEVLLALTMIPGCALAPLPLLASTRRRLRTQIHASKNWVAAWTIAGSAGVAVEGLFIWRLVRNLMTPFANLPTPSLHALYFGIGFLTVGMIMIVVLAGASSSARHDACAR